MAYKLLVFDLDGTIADTRTDLANAVNHSLRGLGRQELSTDKIGEFVGDGLQKLMTRVLDATGGTAQQLENSIESFNSYYKEHLVDNTTLYPGVIETLKSIQGQQLAVLTNKPRHYSIPILEHLGVNSFFQEVYGGDSFPVKKPDPFTLLEVIKKHGVEKNETLMVGDSIIDVSTARAAGVLVCAVSYGFTSHDKLAAIYPDWLICDLRQLSAILNK